MNLTFEQIQALIKLAHAENVSELALGDLQVWFHKPQAPAAEEAKAPAPPLAPASKPLTPLEEEALRRAVAFGDELEAWYNSGLPTEDKEEEL